MSSSPAKRKVAGEAVEGTKKAKENVNKDICAFLNELADFEKNVSRHMHKHNAYRKASRAVAVYPKRITSGKEAKKLEGVGEKIAKKIDEFLATGKLEKLEKIHANPHHKAIQLFASIVGFGPVAAQRYVAEGITTIEELVKQDTLTATQRIGVQHFEDFAKRIPRAEVDQLKAKAFELMEQVDPKLKGQVCGSYRRGAASSGDIDILVTHPEFTAACKAPKGAIKDKRFKTMLQRVVDHMQAAGFVTASLSCGETKFMGVCSLTPDGIARRIDIRFWPHDQYPLALLYFTGSDELNKEMRRKAIEMSFRLNEYSLVPLGEGGVEGEPFPISSEQDVFTYLDMQYLEPSRR
eukprot:m.155279 g.155279  ORF g.155279 m.155279 type:complete len:351 (+) comp14309_c0_seq3:218-1270(+)